MTSMQATFQTVSVQRLLSPRHWGSQGERRRSRAHLHQPPWLHGAAEDWRRQSVAKRVCNLFPWTVIHVSVDLVIYQIYIFCAFQLPRRLSSATYLSCVALLTPSMVSTGPTTELHTITSNGMLTSSTEVPNTPPPPLLSLLFLPLILNHRFLPPIQRKNAHLRMTLLAKRATGRGLQVGNYTTLSHSWMKW